MIRHPHASLPFLLLVGVLDLSPTERRVLAQPEVFKYFERLGGRRAFGDPPVYFIPDENEPYFRERLAAAVGNERAPTNKRYGKEYAGPAVEEVVRRAHAEQESGKTLGRTFRNKVAEEVGVSTYEVDLIFRLVKAGTLADAGREGWLKVAEVVSTTPAFINLRELETRS
jgi:hypothetical protein